MVTKFAVLGSCACRDIFYSGLNKDYKNFFQIVGDGTRCSLISLMQDKMHLDDNLLIVHPIDEGNNLNYSNGLKMI